MKKILIKSTLEMENKSSGNISCHEGIFFFVYVHKIKQAQCSWRKEERERWYKLKDEKGEGECKEECWELTDSAGKKKQLQEPQRVKPQLGGQGGKKEVLE